MPAIDDQPPSQHQPRPRLTAFLLGLACIGALYQPMAARPVAAQTVAPAAQPVRLLVPFAPGGGTDVAARLLAERLQAALGGSVIVENRPGATGSIAAREVARAPADGHVLLVGTAGTQAVAPVLAGSRSAFDPVADFMPVASIGTTPNLIVVPGHSPYVSLAALVADARARPEALSFGSSGAGTVSHLTAELLRFHAGFKALHVPYRGGAAAFGDLVSGRVQFMVDVPVALVEQVKAGALRALAVTATRRLVSLPDVPTAAEAGFPAVQSEVWIGLFAPKGTPGPVVQRLTQAVAAIVRDQAFAERLATLGFEPLGGGPEQLAALLRTDRDRWSQLVDGLGLKAD
ncbi:Bug family tripartite tricarboxylate transporter substrate binding protein [Phreatobacter stygius]|uniref:Tripartite tricarboxylate transporter substrate binding protein n=1 Tax=Phreatobacter stygius TaxID=1940610 RepID=A0A4D7AYG7_9HYPH|nr:tripartite tricarboxylate transporter substrate binding protein [Phreatobacter stygius]QCI65311.1 tripartite tricarboxylate transporter substrate binding protein [Phreatobacter stygius]